jgi:hypothetical protein
MFEEVEELFKYLQFAIRKIGTRSGIIPHTSGIVNSSVCILCENYFIIL